VLEKEFPGKQKPKTEKISRKGANRRENKPQIHANGVGI
jgi:hypothetical protein